MTRSQSDIETAIDWLVLLQGDAVSEDDWRTFDAWLTASPSHALAYDAALAFDQRLDLDARLAERAGPPATAPTAKVIALRPSRRRTFLWSAGGALAAAAIAGAVWLPASGLIGGRDAVYETGVGERKTIALEDGTRIELNAASRLTVRYQRDARHVKLEDAQAFFDVAKDARRPFLIEAGDTQVRVVGTQFDVRHRDGQLAVAVQRGLVEVRPADAAPVRLRPGQGLSHSEGRADARVGDVPIDEVTGWRHGRLIYRDRPLSEIVGDLNRLFPRPVKIADARAADMRLSGVLIVDSQDAMVGRLSYLLPLRSTTTQDAIVIRAR